MTSHEKVETVMRAIAAINAREIDAYLACCTEDIELLTPMAPLGGDYQGPSGIRRFLVDIADTAPDFRIEVQQAEEVGTGQVLAYLRVRSHGRASGIESKSESANVYDFADGKIRRVRIFFDRAEARRDVGLET